MANMNFGVNLLPKTTNTYTLGNSDKKWNLFVNEINGTALSSLIPDVSGFYTKPSGGIPASDLAETYLTASTEKWHDYTVDAGNTLSGNSLRVLVVKSSNNKIFYQLANKTPTDGQIAMYSTDGCLNSTTPSANDNSTKVATTAYVDSAVSNMSGGGSGITGITLVSTSLTPSNGIVTIPAMTACTSSAAGTAGAVPAPAAGDEDKFLSGDGTWKAGGLPMVILSYGNSNWSSFINAYNNNVIVYCRASSNSNPATGSQTRMAFMAYVNDASNPTNVEFQYYRSVNPNQKSMSQLCDQVFIYKLDKSSGWSVTTREACIKTIEFDSGTGLTGSYNTSNGKLTISTT